MDGAVLSPDGHTVAFTSPVGDFDQIFVMLASGGDPLQLTNDPVNKLVAFLFGGWDTYLLLPEFIRQRNPQRAYAGRILHICGFGIRICHV